MSRKIGFKPLNTKYFLLFLKIVRWEHFKIYNIIIVIGNFNVTGESPKQLVHKQTTKWKRDRKSRLPEYTRKSDPKIQDGVVAAESFSETNSTDIVDISNHTFKNGCTTEVNTRHHNRVGINGNSSVDTPLDMTVRQRGLPPSYSQTINSPNYRSSSRPQVIANEDPAVREDIPSG